MKKLLTVLMTLTLVIGLLGGMAPAVKEVNAATRITINETNFPDKNLRGSLFECSETSGNTIATSIDRLELAKVTNFKGLELFTKINDLYISRTKTNNFKLSGKPKIDGIYFEECTIENCELLNINPLKRFEVTKGNKINKFTVSGVKSKKFDWGSDDHYVKNLVIKDAPNVTYAYITGFNKTLQSFEFDNLPKLNEIVSNQEKARVGASNLKISKCPSLRKLYVDGHRLNKVEVSNPDKLQLLSCEDNNFTTFDAKKFKSLKILRISNNPLKSLNLNAGITELEISNTKLKPIDFRKNKSLKTVDIDGLNWKKINVTKCKNLKHLSCDNNKLKKLNVKKNKKLKYLYCVNNRLKKLNISKNKKLEYVTCAHNRLKKIVIGNNKKLQYLDCSYNKLTKISAGAKNFYRLVCKKNKLKKINISKCKNIQYLECSNNKLKRLNLKKNKHLVGLECNNNRIKKLNLSKNKELYVLNCKHNKIKVLNLKKCTYMRKKFFKCDKKVKVIKNKGFNKK